jgi:Zn-dependent protease
MIFLSFILALTIHEAAHAWVAYRLGDPTPKIQGRLTLNPLAHIDLYGTILIPLFLSLAGSPFIFGWAKPVIFDPFNLKNERRDSALISLAGPLSNLLFSALLSLILHLTGPAVIGSLATQLIIQTISVNIVLAVFNLIPIHPLDGGKIFVGLIPEKDAYDVDDFLNRYGTLLLILLIFPIWGGVSPISLFIFPITRFILNLLLIGFPYT